MTAPTGRGGQPAEQLGLPCAAVAGEHGRQAVYSETSGVALQLAKEVQSLLGGRLRFGGFERHAQAVIGVGGHGLVAELKLTDDRVEQPLDAG